MSTTKIIYSKADAMRDISNQIELITLENGTEIIHNWMVKFGAAMN